MKKIMYILALGLLVSFVSCLPDEVVEKRKAFKSEAEKRITVKGYFSSPTTYYEIIEVDGYEYLSNSHGGIIKLEKKVEE